MPELPSTPVRRLSALVSGGVLVAALVGCGSDAADLAAESTSATTPSDATSQTSTPPEPTEPSESTDTTDAPPGDSIAGDGYTYAIPQGWEDVSDEPESAQADSAVRISDARKGFGTNVNVIVGASPGADDIESLRDDFRQEIEDDVDSEVEAVEDITIDGEAAIGQTASLAQDGETLVFTQYFTLHDDHIYAVTLTAPEDDTDTGAAGLQSILSSWTFD